MEMVIKTSHNRRLAQWRVTWLIEPSTSHQLLWCIDSFVLRNPPLRQAPKRCGEIRSAPFATSVRRITSADVARRYANFAHL